VSEQDDHQQRYGADMLAEPVQPRNQQRSTEHE
jgi:hypothetical protein